MSRPFEVKLTEKMYINGRVVEVNRRQPMEQPQVSDDKRLENYKKERAQSVVHKVNQ